MAKHHAYEQAPLELAEVFQVPSTAFHGIHTENDLVATNPYPPQTSPLGPVDGTHTEKDVTHVQQLDFF